LNIKKTKKVSRKSIDKFIFATFMQTKLEHKYFRKYIVKQEKLSSSRYTNTCKDIRILEYIILNYKNY